MESKEQSLSKIVTALSGVNWGKDVEENHLKRIANSLESVTKEQEKSIIEILSGGSGGGCVPTTHAELKNLRDNGQLSPGTLYRITDYVATTVQEGTKSANHPFDIVVVALDEKTLSEDAGAIAHSEEDLTKYKSVTWTDDSGTHTAPFLVETNITMFDRTFLIVVFAENEDTWVLYNPQHPEVITINLSTENIEKTEDGYVIIGEPELEDTENYTIESGYFAYSNLPAWQLKYCLDNDTDKFAWAQKEVPATEGVPFSLMTNNQFNWDTSGSKINSGTAIFTRYQEGDPAFAPGYYAWGVVAYSQDRLFTAPGLDYTNIRTEFGFYYTESEHPTLSDTFYYKVWGQDRLEPLASKLFEYTTEGRSGGKGVIYWMKDEHNNEAPFDFKGIMFSVASEALNSDWLNEVFPDASFTSIDLYYLSYVNMISLDVKDASIIPQNSNFEISNNISIKGVPDNRSIPSIIIVNTSEEALCTENYFKNCNTAIIGSNCGRIHLDGSSNTMTVFIANNCYNIELFSYNNCYIHSNCNDIKINTGGKFTIPSSSNKIIAPDPIYCGGEQLSNTTQGVLYIGVNSDSNLVCWNPADISSAQPLPQAS